MRAALFAMALAAVALGGCHAQTDQTAANLAASKTFLMNNAKAAGVVTLPSGLQYKIVTSGPASGVHPGPGDEVKVNYEGKLVNGTVFDSSFARGEPLSFPLDRVIPGWTEALQLMRPGDEWILYVPPELGYGAKAAGPIPPDSVLIFRVQLLAILPAPPENG